MPTSKQRIFVAEYLVDRNAAQAAFRAGYSEKTADRQGYRLLRNAEIAAAIEKATQARTDELALNADLVLHGIRKTISLAENREQYGAALRGYELLGKHLGMWKDRGFSTGGLDRLKELADACRGIDTDDDGDQDA